MSKRTASQFFDRLVDTLTAAAQLKLEQRRSSVDAELRSLSEGLRLAQQQRGAGKADHAMVAAFAAGVVFGRLEKKLVSQRGGDATADIKASRVTEKAAVDQHILKLWAGRKLKERHTRAYARIGKRVGRSPRYVQSVVNKHIRSGK